MAEPVSRTRGARDSWRSNYDSDLNEYNKSQDEIRLLEERLARLQQMNAIGSKWFTKAGIRKMIARLHEELAVYEGSEEAKHAETK